MPSLRRNARLLLPLLVLIGSLGVAYAAHEPAESVRIPYQGHLDLDGQPVEGEASLTFELYDAEAGGAQIYTETATVLIAGGTFSHMLGEDVALDSADIAGKDLWLAVSVEGTPLGGRQRVTPAPRAVLADRAHDLTLTTSRAGWAGWREALHLDTPDHAAITHQNLLFGLHGTAQGFFWANTGNTPGVYDMSLDTVTNTLQVDNLGSIRATGISIGHGTPVTKLAHGRAGNCASGSLASSQAATFGTTFSAAPRVFLQPREEDDAGCVTARITNVTTTGFTLRSYTTDGTFGCGCVDWLAIGS